MKLSIVSTLFKSEPHIEEFHRRATAAAKEMSGDDYEIVFVNDGSPDGSLDLAVRLAKDDPHLVVVDLSRNFGHHKAIMTGLSYTRGDRIFLIDSDLEEDPAWLADFAEQMDAETCDVVYGVQETRKSGWFERWTGDWFYSFFNALTDIRIPANLMTARLMTRRYVDALLLHDEREVFLAGLWKITGFDQRPRLVTKLSVSETTYTLKAKIDIIVNSVTSFSSMPLLGIFYIGLTILLVACFYVGYTLVNWMFLGHPISGWTSLIASIWILGGLTISFIGVIGIYLSKIFSETKRRPYSIVRQVHRQPVSDRPTVPASDNR